MNENAKKMTHHVQSSSCPEGAAEELAAALEAASGIEEPAFRWNDPIDGETLKEALDLLLLAPRPDRGLDALERGGVLGAILPEVQALVGFGEGVRHKDVWEHTKKVIRQSPARLAVRWAALLHDVGKVPTRRFESDGQVTFIGHPEVGARMFKRITRRIPFAPAEKERIWFLISAHLRAAAYQESWTDSAVRRFGKEVDDALDDLLDLSRADITSKYAEKVRRGLRQIELLEERVRRIQAEDAKPAPLPKGLGNVIAERFGLQPGRWLGDLMKRLADAVETGVLEVQSEYDHYLSHLEQNPDWFDQARARR